MKTITFYKQEGVTGKLVSQELAVKVLQCLSLRKKSIIDERSAPLVQKIHRNHPAVPLDVFR